MTNILTPDAAPRTMSSREIADLVAARHNDVVCTIERLFNKGLLRSSRNTRRENTGGRPVDVYDLIQRDTHLVVAGYSDEHRARVVDRWQELEAKQTTNTPAVLSRMDILKLAMDSEEARLKAEAERDQAVATKAEIGNRREATAMATASAAMRQVNRLTEQLGRNMRHATIIAVEKAVGRKFGKQDWRPLRDFCKAKGLEAEKVSDARYGEVKAWPAEAWSEVYGIDLGTIFPNAGLQ